MTLDTHTTLALRQNLLLALRANDAEAFKEWLAINLEEIERKSITMGFGKVEVQTKVFWLGTEEFEQLLAKTSVIALTGLPIYLDGSRAPLLYDSQDYCHCCCTVYTCAWISENDCLNKSPRD